MLVLHSKKLLVISLIIFVIVSMVGLVFLLSQFGNDDKPEDLSVQSKEEIQQDVDRINRFDSFNEAANSGDNSKILSSSILFARDESNSLKSRLDAYRLCIQSASELSKTSEKDQCYSEAKLLLPQLREDEKQPWDTVLNNVYNGNNEPVSEDEVESQ